MKTVQFKSTLRHIPYALGVITLLSLAPSASAQVNMSTNTTGQTQKPMHNPHEWSNFSTMDRERLNLTDDQMKQLQDVDSKYIPQYKAMGSEPWKNEKYPAMRQERDQAIRGILTPDQYTQWVKGAEKMKTETPAKNNSGY